MNDWLIWFIFFVPFAVLTYYVYAIFLDWRFILLAPLVAPFMLLWIWALKKALKNQERNTFKEKNDFIQGADIWNTNDRRDHWWKRQMDEMEVIEFLVKLLLEKQAELAVVEYKFNKLKEKQNGRKAKKTS